MRLFIEPNDILMFRDGKPFSGGDDHFARSTFPPPPSTIYGALRSHILSNEWSEFNKFAKDHSRIPENVRREIGTPDESGTLTIKQFLLAEKNNSVTEQIFPMPKDIVKEKGKENGKFYILNPESSIANTVMTDLPTGLHHTWYASEDVLEASSEFLSPEAMKEYLSGNAPKKFIEPKDIFQPEERTGIRKNRSKRSVEDGGLYSVEYFRLKEKAGFSVEVEGTELLKSSGILRLGGDNRTAHYSQALWNDISVEPIKKKVSEKRKFKVLLISPAIFKNGWLPETIDGKTMEGMINGITVRMIGACVGKPLGIGGFDIVKGRPKAMKKAVPAGSVYYFEIKEKDIDKVFEKLWLQSITDERVQEGFGISLIGGY